MLALTYLLKKRSGDFEKSKTEKGDTRQSWSSVCVMLLILGMVFCLPVLGCSRLPTPETAKPTASGRYNVVEFGAKGDGVNMDTGAIQAAIDTCSQNGGGIVIFPSGNYLTGTLVLKSNVTLHLAANATILGSKKLEDFDPPHLIYAENAQSIGIIGRGVIDGQGDFYWRGKKRPYKRPGAMINLQHCQNVSIKEITIRNSPGWTVNLVACDWVKIDGVTILNNREGPNTDGINPISSSNVFISNCYIEGGDDCICLKANYKDKPCENITVSNCVLISDDSAIKLGTGSAGDIKHCVFNNIVIRNTQYGIALFMKDGGSYEDVRFSNITIETSEFPVANPSRGSSTYPIFMDIEPRTKSSKLGTIRNVVFSNIGINTLGGNCLVQGMPDKPIEDVTFDNVRMRVISRKDLSSKHKPRGVRNMPISSNDYASVPADFTFANVRGLTLRNVHLKDETPTTLHQRHAVWGLALEEVTVDRFRGNRKVPNGELATFSFKQCRNVLIRGCQALPQRAAFLRLEGDKTQRVSVIGNDLSEAKEPFEFGKDIKEKVFFQSANWLEDDYEY